MDTKQTFVFYNQNYFFKGVDQTPETNESATTITSNNTNNIYINPNNVNNFFYQKPPKKTPIPQTPQIISDSFDISVPRQKNIVKKASFPNSKIYTKNIIKNDQNTTFYNRSMSQSLMNQNKTRALIKNKLTNNKSQILNQKNLIQNNEKNINNNANQSNSNSGSNNSINNYNSKSDVESFNSKKNKYSKRLSYGSISPPINKMNSANIQNFNKIFNNNNCYFSENEQKIEKTVVLNVEEFLMIEGKLSDVIKCIENYNSCEEESFEFLNFYFNTSLGKNIHKYFLKPQFLQIINRSINLIIFSLIISYDMSKNEDFFIKFKNYLHELLNFSHSIIILLSKYFCNKIVENNSNIWVQRLVKLTQQYDSHPKTGVQIIKEIENYCNIFLERIYILLNQYPNKILININNEIDFISVNELNKIYRDKIHRDLNKNGSILPSSSFLKENKITNNQNISLPYLKTKSNKLYTLVLDLDETLIHFKINPHDENSGKLQFRPYLENFLKEVKKYYELVVFTAATQDYADPIINAIEDKGVKFDFRLYRMHTIIIENDFVKDLSRLGRDLSKTIIVDNMEQNYKLQKNNGISIRPFWGKDTEDTALLDLIDVLQKIAKYNMDVRDGILRFKEDIISKVSSDIFRRAQK